jgi:hypothetical protein
MHPIQPFAQTAAEKSRSGTSNESMERHHVLLPAQARRGQRLPRKIPADVKTLDKQARLNPNRQAGMDRA